MNFITRFQLVGIYACADTDITKVLFDKSQIEANHFLQQSIYRLDAPIYVTTINYKSSNYLGFHVHIR